MASAGVASLREEAEGLGERRAPRGSGDAPRSCSPPPFRAPPLPPPSRPPRRKPGASRVAEDPAVAAEEVAELVGACRRSPPPPLSGLGCGCLTCCPYSWLPLGSCHPRRGEGGGAGFGPVWARYAFTPCAGFPGQRPPRVTCGSNKRGPGGSGGYVRKRRYVSLKGSHTRTNRDRLETLENVETNSIARKKRRQEFKRRATPSDSERRPPRLYRNKATFRQSCLPT